MVKKSKNPGWHELFEFAIKEHSNSSNKVF